MLVGIIIVGIIGMFAIASIAIFSQTERFKHFSAIALIVAIVIYAVMCVGTLIHTTDCNKDNRKPQYELVQEPLYRKI